MKIVLVFAIMANFALSNSRNHTEKYSFRNNRQLRNLKKRAPMLTPNLPKNIEDIKAFCPNTRLTCDGDIPDASTVNRSDSCCFNCVCTDDCYATGTCCYDKIDTSNMVNFGTNGYITESGEICSRTTIGNSWISLFEFKDYLLVQTCRPLLGIDERCSWPDNINMSEMTPVFSLSTKRNYRNEYCAKCNGVADDIIPWTIQLSADHHILFILFRLITNDLHTFNDNLLRKIVDASDVWIDWIPPVEALPFTQTCLQSRYVASNCLRQILFELCDQWNMPVIGKENIYKNIYCKACAEDIYDENMNPIDQCPITKPIEKGNFVGRLNPSLFSKRANHDHRDVLILPVTKYSDSRCKWNEIFYKGQCAELSCPFIYVQDGIRCLEIFTHFGGIGLVYRLTISSPRAKPARETDILEFGKTFVVSDKVNGELCYQAVESRMTTDNYNENVYLMYIIQLTELVAFNYHDVFHDFKRKVSSHNKRQDAKRENYNVYIGKFLAFTVSQNVSFFNVVQAPGAKPTDQYCNGGIAMIELQLCLGIRFYHFSISEDGHAIVEDLVFEVGDFVVLISDNNAVGIHVCLDTFRHMTEPSAAISQVMVAGKTITIYTVLLSVTIIQPF